MVDTDTSLSDQKEIEQGTLSLSHELDGGGGAHITLKLPVSDGELLKYDYAMSVGKTISDVGDVTVGNSMLFAVSCSSVNIQDGLVFVIFYQKNLADIIINSPAYIEFMQVIFSTARFSEFDFVPGEERIVRIERCIKDESV